MKILTLFTVFFAAAFFYSSSVNMAIAGKEVIIEIKERFFIAQTNEIYLNAQDYIGKTVKYEGIFNVYESDINGKKRYFVIRYGPGCCIFDATAGFEVYWNKQYPNQNDWVEVVGVVEEYDEKGIKYLRLALNSLTVLQKRGKETVTR
ncbi:MAG: hypothetical protein LBD46_00920 [Endomicrobium sp.]|jgi:uncharacterized membrane protein YcgQ (UPF0703/DUF1980 family)|nr:hypothetical protein [Endomicrobium sp.]